MLTSVATREAEDVKDDAQAGLPHTAQAGLPHTAAGYAGPVPGSDQWVRFRSEGVTISPDVGSSGHSLSQEMWFLNVPKERNGAPRAPIPTGSESLGNLEAIRMSSLLGKEGKSS